MMDEIFSYYKYGYCKYKDKCKRKHITKECQIKRNCNKRPIKSCNHQGISCFRNDCEYFHVEEHSSKQEVEDKLISLENTIEIMRTKMVEIERKLSK